MRVRENMIYYDELMEIIDKIGNKIDELQDDYEEAPNDFIYDKLLAHKKLYKDLQSLRNDE